MRIFAALAPAVPVASPPASRVRVAYPVLAQRKSSGVFAPQPEPTGMSAAMAAHAELKDFIPDSERALAQEIAKAMQPPLMSRLARIQGTFAGLAEPQLAPAATPADIPPPIPAPHLSIIPQLAMLGPAPPPPSPALMDLMADDPDAGFSTPPSVEWLGKARRERNRARMRNTLAWLATLAIGGAIVAGTMAMLAR
jgi:hypothetical protein